MFSPAVRRARRAQVRTLLANWDRRRAGMSPIQRDSSSSRSGRAAREQFAVQLAISASPRICTAASRLRARGVRALEQLQQRRRRS